jgi:hypothetical protein
MEPEYSILRSVHKAMSVVTVLESKLRFEFLHYTALKLTTLMMQAASTSETSVNFYQTTRRNNPQDIFIS